jgi:hypothetical protein
VPMAELCQLEIVKALLYPMWDDSSSGMMQVVKMVTKFVPIVYEKREGCFLQVY